MIDLLMRALSSAFTLYMMLILLRWSASWLEIDLKSPRWRWMAHAVDPLLEQIRRRLPSTGPFDFAPLAALVGVWLISVLSWSFLLNVRFRG